MKADSEGASLGGASQDAVGDRGWCLCLSGGGFRATLFHLGAIRRLNELGVLARLSTITSVSGGSILSGVLATRWSGLTMGQDGSYTNLENVVARPVREFCSKDLRTAILVGSRLNPLNVPRLIRDSFSLSASFLAEGYEPLYGQVLADLPTPGPGVPRFVLCATNVATGACWHFHGGPEARMGDFYVGYCDARQVRVSEAVAASSAFPPAFGALRLKLSDKIVFSRDDQWGERRVVSLKREGQQHALSKEDILLTDGGVYDNLAVEPVWKTYKTILVSDAGRPFQSTPRSGQDLITRLKRAAEISMEQVAAVRKRWLIDEFLTGRRTGALWALHTQLEEYPLTDARGYGAHFRKLLHGVRTDLDAFTEGEIGCLENHGYSLADAAMRSRAPTLCSNLGAPFRWPNEAWSDERKLTEALSKSAGRQIGRDIWRYVISRARSRVLWK